MSAELGIRQDKKVVLVTGGGRGLGRAIAEAFADQGARVMAADVDASEPRPDEISVRDGEIVPVRMDVSEEESVAEASGRIERSELSVDVLVNNAGIIYKAPVEETDLGRWERVLAVNLTGPMLCAKHFVPEMKRRRSGRIINVSSTTADIGMETYGAYSSTKAGLNGLTRVWAAELAGFGVTVNAVCPGWVDTPMTAGAFVSHLSGEHGVSKDEARRLIFDRVPQGRFVDPAEVAFAVLFLASDAAAAISGSTLSLDTGLASTFQAGLHRNLQDRSAGEHEESWAP